MTAKELLEDAIRIKKFQEIYKKLYPNEPQPTDALLAMLFSYPDIEVFCSDLNLIVVLKTKNYNIFVKHWCAASRELPREKNIKAFLEVKRYVRTFKEPCLSDSLPVEYLKASEPTEFGRFRRLK